MKRRPAREAELGQTARSLVKAADASGFWTYAEVGTETTIELRGEERLFVAPALPSSVVVRGRKGDARFVVVFVEGSCESAYWWTRNHEGRVERDMKTTASVAEDIAKWKRKNGGKITAQRERELRERVFEKVRWNTSKPEPVRLGVRELSVLVKATATPVASIKGVTS